MIRRVAELTVLAVDDELPALDDVARLLRADPAVGEVLTASSGAVALQILAREAVDAVFLDVRMPGLDGVELARVLQRFERGPAIVFVSAHESAAVEAFALRALDYLVKPVSRHRMRETLDRVAAHATETAVAAPDLVPVDSLRGGGTRLLQRHSIRYLESHGDYVRVFADDGRFLLRSSLTDVERRWAPLGFARVHRRFVVNLRRVQELRPLPNDTAVIRFADGTEVPIARRQVAELRRRLRT